MSSLNATPASERVHIGIFGRRNAGKSSLINALTGQDLAIVSPVKGTTTDPVYKAMELLPLGPVMFIDTPGIDDEGELGAQRVAKAYQVLHKTDIAVLVVDAATGTGAPEQKLLAQIRARKLPAVLVYNKLDLAPGIQPAAPEGVTVCQVSSTTKAGINELKETLARLQPQTREVPIVADLLKPGDMVVLVVPVDSAAPKGRLILPQQQTIRDILDAGAHALVTKEDSLAATLDALKTKPRLVITDSQAFKVVNAATPADILLTSFSILMARHKGNLAGAINGVLALNKLQDGDQVLIAEGCTHHRQCDDIGTVKMPGWVENFTGKKLHFAWTSGGEFPADLSPYKLIIHCGGCMLNEKEMQHRYQEGGVQQIPMTNYGLAIAYMHGILKRSLGIFPELAAKLE
jgi:[FeFe] hydrogenase H-cluster maturation GTPase HydF